MATLAEIVARFGGELIGRGDVIISAIAPIDVAGPDQLTFLANSKYRARLATTRAGAVIVSGRDVAGCPAAAIVSSNPYLYYARVAQWLSPTARPEAGIHPSAVVEGSVAASASIGANVWIGSGARIGERAIVGANCSVGANTVIGDDVLLHPGTTVYHDCKIGARSIVHGGAVIGADGFGFAPDEDGRWVKIPQTGRVVIGEDVEVGACTSIDRGALGDTVIEDGVKLDNQIQVAHNVFIGTNTVIAGCVGIAGSTRIGRRCLIGGAASIQGHLEIADGVTISAGTMVSRSIVKTGQYTGWVPCLEHGEWQKNYSRLRHLENMADKIRMLEAKLADLEKKS